MLMKNVSRKITAIRRSDWPIAEYLIVVKTTISRSGMEYLCRKIRNIINSNSNKKLVINIDLRNNDREEFMTYLKAMILKGEYDYWNAYSKDLTIKFNSLIKLRIQ